MSDANKNLIDALKDSKSADDRKKCIPLLQTHLEKHPEDAVAWYDLAGCFDFIREETKAEPCYKKTYDLGYQRLPEKERSSFLVGYGSTLRNNFKFSESRDVLKTAVQEYPNYQPLKVFLAFTLYSQGRFKEAAQSLFAAARALDGKPFDGYESAIKWYADNLETHPPRPLPSTLESERTILRPLVESDAEAIFEYSKDPEVSKFTTWLPHRTVEDSKDWIAYAQSNYQRGIPEPRGLTLKSNPQKVVGSVGWFWTSEQHKSIELAFAISRDFWGQGLVLEAVKTILRDAVQNIEINRISARCRVENLGSARVMEKLGMTYEGTQRQILFVKGRYVDLKVYSILKSEFQL